MPLWRELAATQHGRVADLGCGTGRVALELSEAGHDVTAVDRDPELLEGLMARRPSSAGPDVILADVTRLPRQLGPFSLVLAPMQLVQLLPAAQRTGFLADMPRLLAPNGLIALAVCETVDAVTGAGEPLPDPERIDLDGDLFESRPVAVRPIDGGVEIDRVRIRRSAAGESTQQARIDTLYELSPDDLETEAVQAGLTVAGRRDVPATADHVGSTVVLLRAAS